MNKRQCLLSIQFFENAKTPAISRKGRHGDGFMGRGIALQIVSAVPGMELGTNCNRHA